MVFTEIIPDSIESMPRGSTRGIGSETTETGSYKEIVSYTPRNKKKFGIAKILVTWAGTDEQDIAVKLDGEIIGEYYSTDFIMDWFPPGVAIVGDGVKKVVIEAMAIATPATLIGFIAGEES